MFDFLHSAPLLHARSLSCVNVNVEETMGSARDSLLAATRVYVVRGNDSDAAKLSALGWL